MNTKKILDARKHCRSVLLEAERHRDLDRAEQSINKVRRSIPIAIKLDMIDEVKRFSMLLLKYYYSRYSRKSTIEKYEKIHDEYLERSYTLEVVTRKHLSIKEKLNTKWQPSKGIISELESICQDIEQYTEVGSPTVNAYIYILKARLLELQNKPSDVITLCRKAIEELEAVGRSRHFHNFTIQSFMKLGRFEDAEQSARAALNGLRDGNTFDSAMINYITLELHRANYEKAFSLFNSPTGFDKRLPELYGILRGYFYFLAKTEKIRYSVDFKLWKFLNTVEIVPRDKNGHSVNIQILKILYYLGTDNCKIIDSYDAIKEYNRVHGRGRCRIFLQMLLKIIYYKFKPEVIALRTRDDLKKLNKLPINYDIEYIPYTHLWELAIKLVEQGAFAS